MLFTNMTFIGIDPTAGQKPFAYAALGQNLELLALGLCSIDEVLAFVGGQRAAVVAVCSPPRPNLGVMNHPEVRAQLSPPPRPGRWTNLRLAEYQLRQRRIPVFTTPAEAQACPRWMRNGFRLYERMAQFDYQPYPRDDHPHQWLEVYPHACFTVLANHRPFPKHTLEGRLQRQLILYQLKLGISDPMLFFEEITRHRLMQGILPLENLYTAMELDALVAAYTARVAALQPDQVILLGDTEEGQITLPVPELKPYY
jgi:hypothetical protein